MSAPYLRPAYAPDTPLTALFTAELLLVATFRLFVRARREPDAASDWRSGFQTAGIDEHGVPAFDGLFTIVTALRPQPLAVHCMHCRFLAADEGRLLHLVALLQGLRDEDAEVVLADWLPAAGVRIGMVPARRLADALAFGGLIVPIRQAKPREHRYFISVRGDPGLALVH